MKSFKPVYWIKAPGGVWVRCKKALASESAWLRYELSDGTIGMKKPGDWRGDPIKRTPV